MKLEIGSVYCVLFTDGKTECFKFLGGEPPEIEVKGKKSELIKVLQKPHLCYWEVEDNDPFVV